MTTATAAPPARAPRPAAPRAPENEARPAAPRGDRAHFALVLAVSVGVCLRLLQYGAGRSLWLDEALLANNVVNRPLAALAAPLEHGQTAPLGFLLLERAAVALFGGGEHALRLVPLLAGIAALFAFVALARKVLSPAAVPLAAAMFALASFLVYYASEVKPYSTDVLVAVTLLWLAADGVRARPGWGRLTALLVAGTLAVWLSQPAVFVLAGVGLTLLAAALRRREHGAAAALVVIGAAWMLSFAGAYAASRGALADAEYMRAFWRSGFLPLAPRTAGEWLWLPRAALRVFMDPFGVMADAPRTRYPAALAGLVAAGVACAALLREGRGRAALLLSPLAFVLAASALELYPLGSDRPTGGRVILFLLPVLLLLAAEGATRVKARLPLAGYALFALLLVPQAAYAARAVPHVRSEVKPLLAYAREHWREGDRLYVYYAARAQAEYYAPRYGFAAGDVVLGRCARLAPQRYLDELRSLAGAPRTWVLLVEGEGAYGWDERGLLVGYLDRAARRLDDRVSVGASLYLYDTGALRPELRLAEEPLAPLPHAPEYDCRGPWAGSAG